VEFTKVFVEKCSILAYLTYALSLKTKLDFLFYFFVVITLGQEKKAHQNAFFV